MQVAERSYLRMLCAVLYRTYCQEGTYVQCLSLPTSVHKGVKGLPLHLQVDTYVKNPADGEYDIVHRSYCQVKVFCDKGAERKFRQEERRATRKVAAGGQRVLDMYHQCQERSEFY